jgi:hypothetical protein
MLIEHLAHACGLMCQAFLFFGWLSLCDLGVLSEAGVRNGLAGSDRSHAKTRGTGVEFEPGRRLYWMLANGSCKYSGISS